MKKIASISLLVLTLLIAVQPTLFLHFCQGELSSVALQSNKKINCCGSELPMDGIHHKGCCNDGAAVLSTDSYQSPEAQFNFNLVSAFVIVQNHLLISSEYSPTLSKERITPTGFLFRKVLDRLSFICVYRI